MAFCNRCGKALNEGEICSCRSTVQAQTTQNQAQSTPNQTQSTPNQAQSTPNQAQSTQVIKPNAFLELLKSIWAIIVGVLKNPVTSIRTFVQKSDFKISCILIGIHAIIVALITWFGMLKTNSNKVLDSDFDISELMSDLYGTSSSVSSKFSAGDMISQMLQSALYVIVVAVVVAVIIMIAANSFGKTKVTFIQGLAVASLVSILAIPAAIIVYIFELFGVEFFSVLGNMISEFAVAVGAIYVFFGIRTLCEDEDKLPFIAGICAAFSALSIYLIGFMF